MNDILETVGLTHHGFLKLRDKYFEWQENTQHEELEGSDAKNGKREDVVDSNELIR